MPLVICVFGQYEAATIPGYTLSRRKGRCHVKLFGKPLIVPNGSVLVIDRKSKSYVIVEGFKIEPHDFDSNKKLEDLVRTAYEKSIEQ